MSREPLAQVGHNAIGRTTSRRRDEAGLPIEESVATLRSLVMYDLDGNEVRIPTHCHRAFVQQFDDKYRPRVVRDRLEDGFLEAGKCPHMPREQLDDKPSAPAPQGFTTCDGKGPADAAAKGEVQGCQHLVAIVAERRRRAAARAADRKNPGTQAAVLAMAQRLSKEAITAGVASAKRKPTAAERVSE